MRFPPLAVWFPNHFRKTSLRQILIELLVLQVFVAVGVTGWLSFRNGQKSVSDLSNQLRAEVSDRVQQHLQNYLGQPHVIAQANINAAQLSELQLKLQGKIALERHFALQLQQFSSVSQIYFGRTDGSIVLTGFHESGKLMSGSTEDFPKRLFYLLNERGQRAELLPETESNFDARIRPWFQSATTAKKPIWSRIYTFARGEIGITASHPLYDERGNLLGVMAVDLVLGRIGDFLHSLKITPTGQLFILERSGLLVASSTGEKPYTFNEQSQRAERLQAIYSSNRLTRETAKFLAANYQNLSLVKSSQLTEFEIDGNRQFLQILPFQDPKGLNWLIVTAIPESDFVEHINASTKTTLLLCVAAFITTIGVGILAVRRVTAPILQLNELTKGLAQGEIAKTSNIEGIEVIEISHDVCELAGSLNSIAKQLQISLSEIKMLNDELSQTDSQIAQLISALPIGVAVHNQDGTVAYFNQLARQLLSITNIPSASSEQLATTYKAYRAGTDQLYPTENIPAIRALRGESIIIDDMEIHQDGKIIPLEVLATPIFDSKGAIKYAIAIFQDITDRKQAEKLLGDYNQTLQQQVKERTLEYEKEIRDRQRIEAELREKEERLQLALQGNNDGIWDHNLIDNKHFLSPRCREILGYLDRELDNFEEWVDMVHPGDRAHMLYVFENHLQGKTPNYVAEYRMRCKDGSYKWLLSRGQVFRNEQDNPIRMVGSLTDISDRKQTELALKQAKAKIEVANQELEHLVRFDELTQIANRRYFDEYLRQEWQKLEQSQLPLSLIFCDVDYFKAYNDSYGHLAGDRCLEGIASAIRSAVRRPEDLVARYGGEEFAVILPYISSIGVAEVAKTIQTNIAKLQIPHVSSSISPYVTLSFGVATIVPTADLPCTHLVDIADQALYWAKVEGRDRIVTNSEV